MRVATKRTRMRVAMRAGALAVVAAWAACATAASAAPSEESPAAQVTVTLLATLEGGATVVQGTGSSRVVQGATETLHASAGLSAYDAARCGAATSSGGGMGRRAARSRVTGPGFDWEVEVELAGEPAEAYPLRVAWRRSTIEGEEISGGEERLELSPGEKRILDYVPFTHAGCGVYAYHLELSAAPSIAQELAGRGVRYELWFARTRGGLREEFARAVLTADQAEATRFRLAPLVREVPTSDQPILVKSLLKGRVSAWLTAPDRVEILVEPQLEHRIEQTAFHGSLSSGQGRKRFSAGAGETVELEIPPSMGQFMLSADQLVVGDRPIPGIEARGDAVLIRMDELLADTAYSLLIRVQPID